MSSGGTTSILKTNRFLPKGSPVKRTRAECCYGVQFERSYLLITSEKKSTAGPKKEKIQAFSNILAPFDMARVTSPRRALPRRDLLRRLDNSDFGSSCGDQVHRNTPASRSFVSNACSHARERTW